MLGCGAQIISGQFAILGPNISFLVTQNANISAGQRRTYTCSGLEFPNPQAAAITFSAQYDVNLIFWTWHRDLKIGPFVWYPETRQWVEGEPL